MPHENDDAIARAVDLQRRIDALYEEQDKLLTPICVAAMKADNPNLTMRLVHQMPRGYHRTELRTFHIQRMNEDLEYRLRYQRQDEAHSDEHGDDAPTDDAEGVAPSP